MILKNKILFMFLLFLVINSVLGRFDLTQSVYDFAVASFQDVDKQNANFIMSPLSAQLILALTYDGASGKTARDMNTGLYLKGQNQGEVINDFRSLSYSLMNVQRNTNTTLTIANKIYISNNFEICPTFKMDAEKLQSSTESINFADNTEAADEINDWASRQTHGTIQDVVQSSQFDDGTVMVLINAIYFQGVWMHQFDRDITSPNTFYTSQTASQIILMMNNQDNFNYGSISQLDATALQMNYRDPTISMIFLLPNARDGLTDLINALGQANVLTILNQMSTTEVLVRIPRFTISVNIDLQSVLQQLGMGIIFGSDADFSNIVTSDSSSEHLAVSSVVQQAFIQVNEFGSKAAAVTVVEVEATAALVTSSSNQEIPQFIADHPFVMMIVKDNDVMFIGCFVEGTPLNNDYNESSTTTSPTSTSGVSN